MNWTDDMLNFFADLRSKLDAGTLRRADLTPRALATYYHGDTQRFLTDVIVLLQEFRNEVSYLNAFGEPSEVAVTTDWQTAAAGQTTSAA